MDDKGCHGAPDLVVEVASPSTSKRDYGLKLFKYRTAGVKEYWIVNPEEETVTKYMLSDEEFNLKSYGFDEKIPVGICEDFFIEING